MLAARPELVKMEKAEAGWPPFPHLKGSAIPTILAFFRDPHRLLLPGDARWRLG